MPRKVFTAGEILTAANLNDVSDQTVMVFDDAAARTTAIPTPVEGMVTYLKDADSVQVFDGSVFAPFGGKILQVVSVNKTDTFSTTSTTFTALTGLSASITPSSATSKILITCLVTYGTSTRTAMPKIRFMRGATPVGLGDAAGSRLQATTGFWTEASGDAAATDGQGSGFGTFLDSPASSSAITYSVEIGTTEGAVFVNRSGGDTNNTSMRNARTISNITLMEVSA